MGNRLSSPHKDFASSGLKAGPVAELPTRQSFGSRLMKSLGQQLNGKVQLAYQPARFIYSLDVPLGSIAAAP